MDARTLAKRKKDLATFLDEVAGTLGNSRRRRWCESYLRGVLLNGHRKSVEPMAARLKGIEQGEHDYEQGLHNSSTKVPGMSRGKHTEYQRLATSDRAH